MLAVGYSIDTHWFITWTKDNLVYSSASPNPIELTIKAKEPITY